MMKNLDVLIGQAAGSMTRRRTQEQSGDSDQPMDSLLFMGNPHETVPRTLLLDTRLGAVDILGWQVIRLLSNSDRTTSFPTYDELEPLLRSGANSKASRKTVARVIAILRLTRWMTLGLRARNTENGRVIGNVYLLHDEPLSAAESLSLDSEYIEFVVQSTRNNNRAVAEVAQMIQNELIKTGVLDVPSRLDIIEQRAEKQRQKQTQFPKETKSKTSEFPMETKGNQKETQPENPSFHGKLRQFPSEETPSFHRKPSLESISYATVSGDESATTVRSSSSTNTYVSKTTGSTSELFWPWQLELTKEQKDSVQLMLTGLPVSTQQSVIDETAGRVEAGKVKSTKGFLLTLAKRAVSNQFQMTHFGESVAEERKAKALHHPASKSVSTTGNYNRLEVDSSSSSGARERLIKQFGIGTKP